MINRTSLASLLLVLIPSTAPAQDVAENRNLVTDEPREVVGKPDGARDYVARTETTDGQHLALSVQKLTDGIDPPRPFLIWALGSSYTNMLGNGEAWKTEIPKRFPNAPPIKYQKMVGNSCPWQFLRGWARHLAVPDQPDLVLIYTLGDPMDLEKLIVELRSQTTADIIVPSIHWRQADEKMWGQSENSPQQNISAVREVCRRHDVEFVENRRDWANYLRENDLPIESLLKDAVHQSEFGAQIINANIISHLKKPERFSYAPESREYRIEPVRRGDGSCTVSFTGNRIDLVGIRSPNGGKMTVRIDGNPASDVEAFLMSYVQPNDDNARVGRGSNPRDQSPHGITLGREVIPQQWTIVMTSDVGDYQLTVSIAGEDGVGNAFEPFTSESGQIQLDPALWRRAERNRTGDRFTFEVRRSAISEIDFRGEAGERFRVRVAQALSGGAHTLELVPTEGGATKIEFFQAFRPPMAKND